MMLMVNRCYRRAHSHVIIAGVGSVGRIVKPTEHGLHGQTDPGAFETQLCHFLTMCPQHK